MPDWISVQSAGIFPPPFFEAFEGGLHCGRDSSPELLRPECPLRGEDVLTQKVKIWRINLGFRRRANQAVKGFMLDTERGYWAKNEQNPEDEDDPLSDVVKRVIPFVSDHRNALLLEACSKLDADVLALLQAALKHAIQVEFELEDNELAAEPLPNRDSRNLILLCKASKGAAGVLRQLLDADAFVRVCRRALALCHFDPDTGADLGKAPRSKENCEADVGLEVDGDGVRCVVDLLACLDLGHKAASGLCGSAAHRDGLAEGVEVHGRRGLVVSAGLDRAPRRGLHLGLFLPAPHKAGAEAQQKNQNPFKIRLSHPC